MTGSLHGLQTPALTATGISPGLPDPKRSDRLPLILRACWVYPTVITRGHDAAYVVKKEQYRKIIHFTTRSWKALKILGFAPSWPYFWRQILSTKNKERCPIGDWHGSLNLGIWPKSWRVISQEHTSIPIYLELMSGYVDLPPSFFGNVGLWTVGKPEITRCLLTFGMNWFIIANVKVRNMRFWDFVKCITLRNFLLNKGNGQPVSQGWPYGRRNRSQNNFSDFFL